MPLELAVYFPEFSFFLHDKVKCLLIQLVDLISWWYFWFLCAYKNQTSLKFDNVTKTEKDTLRETIQSQTLNTGNLSKSFAVKCDFRVNKHDARQKESVIIVFGLFLTENVQNLSQSLLSDRLLHHVMVHRLPLVLCVFEVLHTRSDGKYET